MPVSNAPKIVCKKQYDTYSSDANVKQNIDNMTDLMQIFSKTDNKWNVVTYSEMSVNAGISGGPCEILVFSVWNMLMSSCISILFGKSKVYNIHKISFLSQSHEKVIRLHISMDEVFGVYVFYPTDL